MNTFTLFKDYKAWAFLIALIAITNNLYSQSENTIRGVIQSDSTHESLAGAIVTIKGTTIGTVTDSAGYFELRTTQAPPVTLEINYVGFITTEATFNGEIEPLEIKVKPNPAEAAVIVGYGTQKKSDVTGSTSTVPKEVMGQPVSSADRLLQGSVAGALVSQTSGQPGSGTTVQIRGVGSVNAGGQPLYVIDGFPWYNDPSSIDAGVTYNTFNTNTTGGAPQINPLSTINPSDIESIDVLKDASATAIYGSRGANGVVVITTKKGSRGKNSVNFDSYIGVQSPIKTIPLINATQEEQLANDAAVNSGKAATFNPAQIAAAGNGTNWENAAFVKGAGSRIQNYNLSILSGTDKTRIALSGNYFDQDGILLNTWFKRYTGRINIEHDYNKNFKIGAYSTLSQISSQVAPQNVVPDILAMQPTVPIYTNGAYTVKSTLPGESALGNPINSLVNDINTTTTLRALTNGFAEYTILPKLIPGKLTAKALGGIDLISNRENSYLPSTTYEGQGSNGVASIGALNSTTWLNENTLNYSHKIKKHSFDAIGLFSQQSSYTQDVIANAAGFGNNFLSFNNLGTGTVQVTPQSAQSDWAIKSYMGRINYQYDNRYLLTVTARTDGSSRFAPGHQWGDFPSAAIGWNAHNEKFLKDVKQITNLKFRFSAGLTGNQQIPPFTSQSQMGYYRYNFGNTTLAGFAPTTQFNPNLTWEKTAQYDLGFDLGLFENRITVVSDIYYKKTTNLLLDVTLPATTGLLNLNPNVLQDQAYENAGAMSNKGIELAVNSKNLVGKFKWNTALVFSHNVNDVLSLNSGATQYIPNSAAPSVLAVGHPVGSFIVYQTNGLVPAGHSGTNALTPAADHGVGAQQYADINGDGKITAADRVIINNQPKFIAGLTNTFNFARFDLTIFIQTVYGNKIYNANAANLDLETGYQGASTAVLNRYTTTNTNTSIPRAYQDPSQILSTRYIEDGSYMRLKNVTLGYTFEKAWFNGHLQKLRIYVSLQNWLTWTKYSGFDPEVSVNGQNPITSGIDNGAYPNYKTILGGLSLSF